LIDQDDPDCSVSLIFNFLDFIKKDIQQYLKNINSKDGKIDVNRATEFILEKVKINLIDQFIQRDTLTPSFINW